MIAHLWVSGPQPLEYLVLQLCRLYHCPPSVVLEQPIAMILAHLVCLDAEATVRSWHG